MLQDVFAIQNLNGRAKTPEERRENLAQAFRDQGTSKKKEKRKASQSRKAIETAAEKKRSAEKHAVHERHKAA